MQTVTKKTSTFPSSVEVSEGMKQNYGNETVYRWKIGEIHAVGGEQSNIPGSSKASYETK